MPEETSTLPYYKPDQPAESVPGLKDVAAGIVGTPKAPEQTPEQAFAAIPKPPTSDEIRAATQKSADAQDAMRRRQTSYEEATKPQIEQYRLDAQKHEADAERLLPKQRQATDPPPRGLAPFLASTKDETPETTIAKFVQAISLMATMAGGGRSGARASLSAMTGALEGWSAGNRAKGDRDYKAWKDSTEAMFQEADNEFRAYNAVMRAKAVPLEQRFRGLELAAYEHKNAMAAEEFNVREADKAMAAIEKRIQAYENARKHYSDVVAKKTEGDRKHEEAVAKRKQAYNLRIAEMAQKRELVHARDAQPLDEASLNQRALERAAGAPWSDLVRGWGPNAMAQMAQISKRSDELLAQQAGGDPGLQRLANVAQLKASTQSLVAVTKAAANWSTFDNEFEPAVANALKVMRAYDNRLEMPAIDKWVMRGRAEYAGDPQVKAIDTAMEAVAQLYSRVVIRQGQTAEGTRKVARSIFDPAETPEMFEQAINDVIRPEVEYARNAFKATKNAEVQSIKDLQKKVQQPGGGPSQGGGAAQALPKGAHREGNEIVSDSGKYRWDGKAWIAR